MLKSLIRLVPTLAFTAALVAQDPGTTYHVRVDQAVTPALHQMLHAMYDTGCGKSDTSIEMYLHPDEYRELVRLGVNLKVLGRGRPYSEIVKKNAKGKMPDPNYYTAAEIVAEIDSYAAAHPTIAKKVDLTAMLNAPLTHEGRRIYALKISDDVGTDEDEPGILIASQHHARELNTPVIVFQSIKRILEGYSSNATLKALVDGYEIYCVPCVNPDGTDYVWNRDQWWRKNRRSTYGVDLNRNYPFLYGLCGASSRTTSQTYKGPSAASEPETKTMVALAEWLRPELYLDFHSSGREVLFTYAPCATVSSRIRTFLGGYVTDLRTPMRYATRNPSASGEAPEFHWADTGSMSFLTEIMTSFQPSYVSAVAEATRVWPGILKATTTWRPSVRGHVRSIYKNEPVAATIRYTPNLFHHGEKAASRSRDGRYGMWLPTGTHQVTYSAPGFVSVTKTVQITTANNPRIVDVLMIPTMPTATISKSGTDRIGTTTNLTYRSPGDTGENYWVLLALGTQPGIDLGAGRVLALNPDIAMRASLPPSILTNSYGQMPANGEVTAGFPIPNFPVFIGLTLYAAGVTENSNYLTFVKNFSNPITIQIKQ